RVIDALRPIDLDDSDLAAALRRRFGGSPAGAPVTVDAQDVPPLPVPIEDGVFRVVTEAVANAHRHAGARAVGVHLSVAEGSLVARVSDDGLGLPAVLTPGVGLASMRARAAELGGTLDILSSPSGTDVTLTLPLAIHPERTGVVTCRGAWSWPTTTRCTATGCALRSTVCRRSPSSGRPPTVPSSCGWSPSTLPTWHSPT